MRRLSGRRMLVDGQMVQRDDDKPETVRHRLEVYREQTCAAVGVLRVRGPALPHRRDRRGRRGHRPGACSALGVGRPGTARPRADGRRAAMTAEILSRLPLLAKWSGRMIQIKTPHEIELMRGAGLVVAGAIAAVQAGGPPRRHAPVSSTPSPRTTSAAPARCPPSWATTASPAASAPRSTTRSCTASRAPTGRWPRATTSPSTAGPSCKGWHGDSAVTVTVGEPSAEDAALMDVTERSMWAGLARAFAGGRLTDISAAVEQTDHRRDPRLRHRRQLRRARHRHRDAPGPARAQLRPPGPRPEARARASRWRSSPW